METVQPHTAAVAERIRAANAAGGSLRIVGRGHWLAAGAPCPAPARLDLAHLEGIVEYRPGDLTLTALAGTTLAEIGRATEREGQWLALDPAGSPDGSIGATVATASSGPLASSFGTPRDHVLGCELVTGTGSVVRAGGRVVKNVAGFDLTRLNTGAWGTLGAITEVTVRLRARPAVERSVAIPLAGDDAAERAWDWLRHAVAMPMAAELLSASLARRLAVGDGDTLLLRFGGNAAFVRAATDGALALGRAQEIEAAAWAALRVAEPESAAVVRVSALPSRAAGFWRALSASADAAGGFAHATLTRGVIRCVLPGADTARVSGIVGSFPASATRIFERLPAPLWSEMSSSAANHELSARVRRAFDPARTLNPDIFGGGT